MEFIYYPKCSTCIKALRQLQNQGVQLEKRDIVKDTPTKQELLQWIVDYGQGIRPFFNTSGMVYRELGLKDKLADMSNEEAADLLSSNGMLIKRPLLITNSQIIIGYKKEIYEKL